MNNFINRQLIKLLCIAIVFFTFSCNDKLVEELTSVNFERSFSTTGIDLEQGQTSVLIEWDKALNSSSGTTYTLEVAEEADFSSGAEKSFQSNTNKMNLTDADIEVRKDYYARVKTNAEGEKKESLWVYSGKFKIIGDQYLETIKYAAIQSTQVTVRWDVTKPVTHLTINSTRIDLTPTDLAAGEKVITELTPATAYEVIVFENTADKGVRNFTTKLGVPSGTVKTLNVGDDIKAAIEGASNGDVFVLPQGATFTATGTVAIPNGVSITVFGQEGPNMPTLKTAGTGFSLPAALGNIIFQNIIFDGTTSQYIINQSNATVVDNLTFENCKIIGYANTPIRLQTTAVKTIKKLVVEQCIVGNLSPSQNYAFIHAANDNCKIDDIALTNSTFYNIGIGLILHTNADANALLVDNCTIYDVTKGDNNTRFLISYGAKSVTATIRNSIFAKTKNVNASGILLSNYTSVNNHQSNDYVVAREGVKSVATYAKPSADLFVNPESADFTIKDASFAGKSTAGDPRWRIQ